MRRNDKEIIVFLNKNTRSIKLFDELLKIEKRDTHARIVIKNGITINGITYNYVIENPRESGDGKVLTGIGNITFTEFKTQYDKNCLWYRIYEKDDYDNIFDKKERDERKKIDDLNRFLVKEVTDDIIEKYINSNEFYRFKTYYKLRAQSSDNLRGFGWEWDWVYYPGTYTEGTYYGETDNYNFVGVYISDSQYYDPSTRRDLPDIYEISVSGYRKRIYKLLVYKQELEYWRKKRAEKVLILLKNGQEIEALFNNQKGIFYIPYSEFVFYDRNIFCNIKYRKWEERNNVKKRYKSLQSIDGTDEEVKLISEILEKAKELPWEYVPQKFENRRFSPIKYEKYRTYYKGKDICLKIYENPPKGDKVLYYLNGKPIENSEGFILRTKIKFSMGNKHH